MPNQISTVRSRPDLRPIVVRSQTSSSASLAFMAGEVTPPRITRRSYWLGDGDGDDDGDGFAEGEPDGEGDADGGGEGDGCFVAGATSSGVGGSGGGGGVASETRKSTTTITSPAATDIANVLEPTSGRAPVLCAEDLYARRSGVRCTPSAAAPAHGALA